MRRLIGLLSLATVIGAAAAASQDNATEGRAYLGFSFGGATLAPRDFHYGLRLDYDNGYGYEMRPAAPLMQFDFTARGLDAAKVNGLSVLKKAYRLQQNENPSVPTSDAAAPADAAPPAEAPPADAGAPPADAGAAPADAGAPPADAAAAPTEVPAAEAGAAAEAAPAEQAGFFARSWHGIKSFFGMGDSTEVAKTEAKPADQPAEKPAEEPKENPADVAQGTFMSYNVVDWATLAVGAVGLGAIVSEVAQHDQSNDSGSSTTGGSTTGTPVLSTGAISTLPTGGLTGGLTGALTGALTGGFAGSPEARQMSKELKERLEWLDGGTGHMGDLEPAKN